MAELSLDELQIIKIKQEIKSLSIKNKDEELDVDIKKQGLIFAEEKAKLAKIKREKEENQFVHIDEITESLQSKFLELEENLIIAVTAKRTQKIITKVFDELLNRRTSKKQLKE